MRSFRGTLTLDLVGRVSGVTADLAARALHGGLRAGARDARLDREVVPSAMRRTGPPMWLG